MYYTVAEIKEMYKGRYDDIEFYRFRFGQKMIHTDYIEYIEDVSDDAPVEDFELMDEERYNFSVQANCEDADFKTWYGGSEALVLVIIVADENNEYE